MLFRVCGTCIARGQLFSRPTIQKHFVDLRFLSKTSAGLVQLGDICSPAAKASVLGALRSATLLGSNGCACALCACVCPCVFMCVCVCLMRPAQRTSLTFKYITSLTRLASSFATSYFTVQVASSRQSLGRGGKPEQA